MKDRILGIKLGKVGAVIYYEYNNYILLNYGA